MTDESAQPVATPETPDTPPTPKTRTHPGAWIGVIGSVLVGTLLIAAVDQVPSPEEDQNTAEALLPADGSARLISYDDGAEWIVETAYSIGSTFLLQQPYHSAVFQIGALSDANLAIDQQRFWRQTWTDIADDRGQLTELYHLSQAGVRLVSVTGGDNGFSYFPGLVVLPADVRDGSTWTGEGDALPQNLLDYSSQGSARAVADGCLEVTMDITYTDPEQGGAVWLETTETSTWCPGEGLVRSTFSNNGFEGSAEARELGARTLDGALDTVELSFADADDWAIAGLPMLIRDPVFGVTETAVAGVTDGTVTASGIVVFGAGSELVAFAPDDEGNAVRQWIAHPGGQVSELTAIGDAVLVGTTDRVLQAYDAEGGRAWSTTFDDVLGAPPVSDGAGGLLAVSLDGELRRLDLTTGTEYWSTRLDGFASVSPAAKGDRVFTVDRSDTLRATDLESGEEVWSIPYPDAAALAAGDVLFAVDSFGGVSAMDTETGALLWEGTSTGVLESARMAGDLFVLQTSDGTAAYTEEGGLAWVVDAAEGFATDGDRVMVLGADSLSLIDASGTTITSWAVAPVTYGYSNLIYARPDGVWIVGTNFSAQEVAAR